jgi:hypothetical protein
VSIDELVPPEVGSAWPAYVERRATRAKVIDVRRVGVNYGASRASLGLRSLLAAVLPSPPQRDVWALRGVNLTVHSGECVGIVGRNGAGKSTLLRVIAGLIEHDAGSVHVRGRISALLNLGVGFDPLLTGRENVRLVGSLMGSQPFGDEGPSRRRTRLCGDRRQHRRAVANLFIRDARPPGVRRRRHDDRAPCTAP